MCCPCTVYGLKSAQHGAIKRLHRKSSIRRHYRAPFRDHQLRTWIWPDTGGQRLELNCRDKLIIERNNFACLRSLAQCYPHELAEPISPSARTIVISFLSLSSKAPANAGTPKSEGKGIIARYDRDRTTMMTVQAAFPASFFIASNFIRVEMQRICQRRGNRRGNAQLARYRYN